MQTWSKTNKRARATYSWHSLDMSTNLDWISISLHVSFPCPLLDVLLNLFTQQYSFAVCTHNRRSLGIWNWNANDFVQCDETILLIMISRREFSHSVCEKSLISWESFQHSMRRRENGKRSNYNKLLPSFPPLCTPSPGTLVCAPLSLSQCVCWLKGSFRIMSMNRFYTPLKRVNFHVHTKNEKRGSQVRCEKAAFYTLQLCQLIVSFLLFVLLFTRGRIIDATWILKVSVFFTLNRSSIFRQCRGKFP